MIKACCHGSERLWGVSPSEQVHATSRGSERPSLFSGVCIVKHRYRPFLSIPLTSTLFVAPPTLFLLSPPTHPSFLEVMSEYMDDVLQPRSRHSWDVLKAWFKVGPNDVRHDVTEEDSTPAGPGRRVDSPEGGEIVAAGGGAAAAIRSGEQGREEPSDDGGAGVGDGEEGVERKAIATAATTPAAESAAVDVAVAVAPPAAAATAEGGQPAAAASAQAEAATPSPAGAGAAAAEPEATATAAPSVPACAAAPALEAAAADAGVADDPVGVDGDSNDTTAANKGSPSVNGGSGGDWRVVECKVGTDGKCENCGEVLRSVDLSKEDEERLLRQVGVVRCGAVRCLLTDEITLVFDRNSVKV